MDYKSIEYRASKGVLDLLSKEGVEELVEHFFANEPPESIRWVGYNEIADPTRGEEELPMYTVSNGTIDILVWPLVDPKDQRRVLCLQLRQERPSLEGELAWR